MPGNQLLVDGASYLPLPVTKNSPHIRAQCCPAGMYLQDIVIHSMCQPTSLVAPSPDSKPLVANDGSNIEITDEKWWQSATVVAAKYDDLPETLVSGKWFNRDIRLG